MFGRRSHQRFTISDSTTGRLRILRDVLVEQIRNDQLTVISRTAGVIDQTLTLQTAGSAGDPLPVRIRESRPAVLDGTVRHRLSLDVMRTPPASGPGTSGAVLRHIALPALAILTRDISVRVLNGSSSGCLLECPARLEVGAIGSLRLGFDSHELVDDLQIVRCQQIEGASAYHLGVEFLWTMAPTLQSLRLAITDYAVHPSHSAPA